MIWITFFLTILLSSGFLYLTNRFLKKRGISLIKILKCQFRFKKKLVRSKKFLAIIGIYLLLGGIIFIFYNISNRIAFSRLTSGFSEWRNTNGQIYLYIETNNYYDLGYHTGKGIGYNIALMKYELLISSLMFYTGTHF